MCTLSWTRTSDRHAAGYHLFFNRDEQRTREAGTPPEAGVQNGVQYVAPRDGQAGGTWLLANEYMLSIGILNHYAAEASTPEIASPESRGSLVRSLADCRDVAAFDERMPTLDVRDKYQPFVLFAIGREGSSFWRWDGRELEHMPTPADRFLTTSSVEAEAVTASRSAARAALGDEPTPTQLRELHGQHDPAQGAHSILMRRPDAMTVSRTEIAIHDDDLRFDYTAEEPGK